MAIVGYPQDAGTPEHRVGGFYDSLEALEQAADYVSCDVVVPPKVKRGWYMVPAAISDCAVCTRPGGPATEHLPAPEGT